jgi:glutamyl/glutaminyl-tRNA synthetase
MEVTHVVRGDDHISNTPKQILIYRALGSAVPIFGHVPLILGPDKKRLSKRHGATAVGEYEAQGYLPEAMVNFLALLGWSPGGDREVFSRAPSSIPTSSTGSTSSTSCVCQPVRSSRDLRVSSKPPDSSGRRSRPPNDLASRRWSIW